MTEQLTHIMHFNLIYLNKCAVVEVQSFEVLPFTNFHLIALPQLREKYFTVFIYTIYLLAVHERIAPLDYIQDFMVAYKFILQ